MSEEALDHITKEIKQKYEEVLERIVQTARKCNRDPERIHLVVVTKSKPVETIKAVIEAGCRDIGENYVDEAVEKMQMINNPDVVWHMIGHIQSRKAREVSENFHWVESLDRMKVAKRLNSFLKEQGKRLPVLLECNLSGEESKFGFPAWHENQWIGLNKEIDTLCGLEQLDVRGLMTIPPWNLDPEASRPFYRKLQKLRLALSEAFPHLQLTELSMGMSNDFEIAIQEGATIVRVGTAIVGARE